MTTHKTLVQAAVDVSDLELGKEIAVMAKECGADLIEVGTPLIFENGYKAIGEIKKAVGDTPVLADFKFFLTMGLAERAAAEGADYITMLTGYNEFLIEDAIKRCADNHIIPVFYPFSKPEELGALTARMLALGATHFFNHRYAPMGDPSGQDNLAVYKALSPDIHVTITSDDFPEAVDSARAGADCICFGRAIHTPNREAARKWIDAIHKVN